MTSHPNRSRRIAAPGRNPKPAEIRAAREAAGLSQTAAAALVYCTLSGWQRWEQGERRMHPAIYNWFLIAVERASDKQCSIGRGRAMAARK